MSWDDFTKWLERFIAHYSITERLAWMVWGTELFVVVAHLIFLYLYPRDWSFILTSFLFWGPNCLWMAEQVYYDSKLYYGQSHYGLEPHLRRGDPPNGWWDAPGEPDSSELGKRWQPGDEIPKPPKR